MKKEKTKIIILNITDFYCYKYYYTFGQQYKIDHEKNIGHSV
jgi:hypothetical protein